MLEKIKEILSVQFEIDAEDITPDMLLEDDLDADYIDMIDLAMTIEDEFSVEVSDETLENFKTVADIVDFLEQHSRFS